jgi:hypothetical protein
VSPKAGLVEVAKKEVEFGGGDVFLIKAQLVF